MKAPRSILFTIATFSVCWSLTASAEESPTVPGPRVKALQLVNAETNEIIKPIVEGEELNLATLPTKRLNVVADVEGAGIRDVVFSYNRDKRFRVEPSAPYALAGDRGGKYNAWTPRLGDTTIVARITTTSKRDTDPLTVSFKVIDDPNAPARIANKEVDALFSNLESQAAPASDETARAALGSAIVDQRAEPPVPNEATPAPNSRAPLRLNCGGQTLTDRSGTEWQSDKAFTKSASFGSSKLTEDVSGGAIYRSGRDSSRGPLEFHVPLAAGVYTVTFHFMDVYVAEPGRRVFDVVAEEQTLISHLDIVQSAGSQKPLVINRTVVTLDGTLDIAFKPTVGLAMVNALEISQIRQ